MNRHNAKLNAFALQQLHLTANDRVLEIGFGGGVALPTLIGVAAFVGGVDRSREMVKRAKARFAAAVAADRADFWEGTVDAISFETASFSKACTVNTIYFWRSLDAGFAELRRVLSPVAAWWSGSFRKSTWTVEISRQTSSLHARQMRSWGPLAGAGFQDIRVERPTPNTAWNVIVAGCRLSCRRSWRNTTRRLSPR
jgi:ubiquinone/menaquinone biosynthesis C-methylase UbiE